MSTENERGRPGKGGTPFDIADGDNLQDNDRDACPASDATGGES